MQFLTKKYSISLIIVCLYLLSYTLAGLLDYVIFNLQALKGIGQCSDESLEVSNKGYFNWVGYLIIFALPPLIIIFIFRRKTLITMIFGTVIGISYIFISIGILINDIEPICTFSKDVGNGGVLIVISHFIIFKCCCFELFIYFIRSLLRRYQKWSAAPPAIEWANTATKVRAWIATI